MIYAYHVYQIYIYPHTTHTHIYIHLLLLCLARWRASLQQLWEWFRNSSLVIVRITTLMKPNIWEKWKCQLFSCVWLFETTWTATFGKKTLKIYPPVYQCLPCGEIQNEWGLHKVAETKERLKTLITHMPSAMVWIGNSGGPQDGGEEKITRKWHWTWSRLEEAVSNVFHPCPAFGYVERSPVGKRSGGLSSLHLHLTRLTPPSPPLVCDAASLEIRKAAPTLLCKITTMKLPQVLLHLA